MQDSQGPVYAVRWVTLVRRAPIWWLFAMVSLAYLLTAGSNFSTGDAFAELRVAQGLLTHGWIDVPQGHPGQLCGGWGCLGADGRFYATHGIGATLYMLPFYAVAHAIVHLTPIPHCGTWDACVPIHLVSWSTCLAAAAAVALLFLLWQELGYSSTRALAAALLFGFATLWWPYAHFGFDETLDGMLLLAAYREAVRDDVADHTRQWLRCGGLSALTLLVRLPAGAALLPLLVFAAARAWRGERRMRQLLVLMLPMVVAVAFTCWYNWVRFGSWSPLADGHAGNPAEDLVTFPLVSVVGMVISPGKGLLWYMPVVLLALLALPVFTRRHGGTAWLAWTMIGVGILPYLPVRDWIGGAAWGPRFMVSFLPLLSLPLIELPDLLTTWRRRLVAGILIVLSVLLQVTGILVDYNLRLRALASQGVQLTQLIWDPRHSPIPDALGILLGYIAQLHNATLPTSEAQSFNIWWLNLWRNDGVPRVPTLVVALAVLLSWGISVLGLWRSQTVRQEA